MFDFEEDLDERRPGRDRALDQRFRQRIFDVLLQGAAQWTGSVAAVGQSLVQNPLLRFVGHGYGDRTLREILVQLADHEFENLDQVGFAERHEEDDLVHAVQEFGIEGALDFALDQIFDFLGNHLVF